jgi:hypothetical protein
MDQPVIEPAVISKYQRYYQKNKTNEVWLENQRRLKRECYYRHQEEYKTKNREHQRAIYVRKTPAVAPIPEPPAV